MLYWCAADESLLAVSLSIVLMYDAQLTQSLSEQDQCSESVTELNAWWNLCFILTKDPMAGFLLQKLGLRLKTCNGKSCLILHTGVYVCIHFKGAVWFAFFVCIYLENMLISHTCLSEKQCYSQLFDFGVPCRNVCFCFGLCDSAHFHFIQWYFQPGLQVCGKPSVLPWKPENELGQRPTNPLHFSMTRGILKHHQFTVWSSSPSWCMSSIWQPARVWGGGRNNSLQYFGLQWLLKLAVNITYTFNLFIRFIVFCLNYVKWSASGVSKISLRVRSFHLF